jgi:hypothetical protein
MKKELLLFILGIIALCFTSGCASMFSGSSEPVTFNSSPDGATVTVSGEVLGKTPTTITLKRKSGQVVEFDKEGYTKQKMQMTTSFNPWVLANVLWCFACPLSTTTDYVSGAAHEYSPNHYYVTLVPVGSVPTAAETKKTKVKDFIVSNYSSIMQELSTTSGTNIQNAPITLAPSTPSSEYLKTLYTMLEIPEPDRKQAYEKIKSISSNTKDALKFADDVVNAFIK